jgi:hypothetical protein
MKKLEEIVKKTKYLKWINSKDPQNRIELRRVQGIIRKMTTETKNKIWEKICCRVQSYLGGKRSAEEWRILKNLRKNDMKYNVLTTNLLEKGKYFLKDF